MADKNKKKPEEASKAVQNQANNNTQQIPSEEEQLMRRQSAPRPTAESEAQRLLQLQQEKMLASQGVDGNGAVNGIKTVRAPIGEKEVSKLNATLQDYKRGKHSLEQRIVENEEWYKLRHWECMRREKHGKKDEIEPVSAWLVNCILNKHADAMDNFPAPNILPREESDKGEAQMLSSIIPVVLEQNDFEQTYSDNANYKLKNGTSVYGVFWDSSKLNGLGDISIKKIDILNLFWQSGITDIQDSRYVFHVELMDNELIESKYPQTRGKLGGETGTVSKYIYDDTVDTTKKSEVVDCYYKRNIDGKTILHYCKFVNNIVLFATENDERYATTGWYNHGLYPFVVDTLFKIEGCLAGFGYIDLGKDTQTYIDKGNQAILKNVLANATPRHFISGSGSVNEKEYLDINNPLIHVDGMLGQDTIRPIQTNTLSNIHVAVINNKIDELKETTGNRDISTGGTTSGVTAASAIAAMQEAGSKLSRDNNKASFRAFRKVINLVIELIRQFYDLPRCFRITGENGAAEFVRYSSKNIQPQAQGNSYGIDMGFRIPMFDIEVTAQKQSPYSKMAQNELALQFFGAGFFNPQIADQALACLDMMDFDRKQFVMQKISQNGTMLQQIQMMQAQMMQMAQIIDQQNGSNMTEQLAASFGMSAPAMVPGKTPKKGVAEETEALGGEEKKESSTTKNARQKVADSTSPT
jgi:hypothetical protein